MVNQMRYCMLSFLMLSLTLNRRTEKVRNIWQLRIQNTNLLEVLAANPFGQNRHRKDVSESYSHCFRMSTFPHNKHITSSKTQCQLQNCSHCVEQSHLLSSDHNCEKINFSCLSQAGYGIVFYGSPSWLTELFIMCLFLVIV